MPQELPFGPFPAAATITTPLLQISAQTSASTASRLHPVSQLILITFTLGTCESKRTSVMSLLFALVTILELKPIPAIPLLLSVWAAAIPATAVPCEFGEGVTSLWSTI